MSKIWGAPPHAVVRGMEPERQPVAGWTIASFEQFEGWFAIESACRRYLAQVRWPSGFVCPRCQVPSATWTTSRGLWHLPARVNPC